MSTINGSINLMKFVGARKVIDRNNKKCILIPVDDNPSIASGEKGAYANIRIVEKESTFNDRHYTHFVAATISRKTSEELLAKGWSEEQIKAATPILGNLESYVPKEEFEKESFKEDKGFDDLPDDF